MGYIQMDAQKDITLEDIWGNYTFESANLPGFNFLNDGKHYTRLEGTKIQQYDLTTGKLTNTIFNAADLASGYFNGEIDNYAFSADESKILIKSQTEQIYRRSNKAFFYVYNRKNKELKSIFPKRKQRYATFNPQATKVAFVYQNDLYVYDVDQDKAVQVTDDGKENEIINGGTDWVYEEEFGFSKGFQWSSDGQRIAFYRFDESEVKEFTFANYRNNLYPEYVTFKYPKVGEKNSEVTIHIYNVATEETTEADVELKGEYYIPRIKWTNDPTKLFVFRMSRHQNALELLSVDARDGQSRTTLVETNEHYIDIHDNLTFLNDGKSFLWTSEKDGWNHIYLYDLSGKKIRQITKGNWEVTDFYGIDQEKGLLYFQSTETSPLERQVYSIDLEGENKKQLTNLEGWNSAIFSSTFDYFVNTNSTINAPAIYRVLDRNGEKIRVIEDNAKLKRLQKSYGVSPVEFFDMKTIADNVTLNGWMIKPPNFDPKKKYPVFMYLYGGPGSQQVVNRWRGSNYWWFQMLAQQGFIVACVDNRGTGGRGEAFKKMTYLQLGHYETLDQIEAAKYLGRLKYTDASRIGIFGWSYGGYMSSLCLLKGNDIFSAAIAVAPVTNWKWYDTIYTERYMRKEKENAEGYARNSPVNFADRLKGDYLLIHGMGDDNVHFQHSVEMANALISANKQFDTYFYPNRNHGIRGGGARLHLYQKMTDFVQEKLGTKDKSVDKKGPIMKVAPSEKPLMKQKN